MNKSADEDDQFSLQTASPYRIKARQRLIGAVALVVLVAIVMPIFFHAEPRIPSVGLKHNAAERDLALQEAASKDRSTNAMQGDVVNGAKADARDEQGSKPQAIEEPNANADVPTSSRPATEADSAIAKAEVLARAEPAPKPEAAAKSDTPAKSDPAPKADQADHATKNPYPERYPDRYVLQAGAFSQPESADAQVARIRKLGFKVYTDRIKTPKGERVRVRVGPFSSKADAIKAQSKLRQSQLDIPLVGPDE
jgi:DedD protein